MPSDLQLYLKETPTHVFSCEYCTIFKSTYFEEHLRASASEIRHGKIQTYENGSGGSNALLYDPHLIVSLANKAQSVCPLYGPSLVLCNFKGYCLKILYLGWMSVVTLFLIYSQNSANWR